jgi:crotonobetainyl-CoA:carnitine CoA-transferase CaiB-like acyl-CoA transferase
LFVEAPHPFAGTFKTVRSPVSFDGERSLEVTAPPLLGQHNAEFARGWAARAADHEASAANESKA